MKAYELQGIGIERLCLVDRPDPTPGPGEVLLRMRAAALNARDLQILNGHYPTGKGFPLVPLSDGVGEVIEVGRGVTRVHRGDRVAGIFAQRWLEGPRRPESWSSTLGADLDGVLREFMVLHEAGVMPVPSHLTDVEAATFPTAAVAAWQGLVTCGKVKAGDTVLVQGTGGVALFALQFARMSGARVIALSRSAAKLERARAIGASDVILATGDDWAVRVLDLTGGEGVDHIVDVVGDLRASLACLRIGGAISQIGYLGGMRLDADIIPLLLTNARLHGISVGPRSTFEEMNRAIALHRMRPVVDSAIPFERIREAFTSFANETRVGKVVVSFPS
jgi:NADPH:quinone reductase-like Zn-dependent oxidoreductase